ncbi:MAG TPA: hypothetical protein VNK04_10515 [Gemmataceae bacterium]|nr:hypothetical protein [Gemmataceae bacterium]
MRSLTMSAVALAVAVLLVGPVPGQQTPPATGQPRPGQVPPAGQPGQVPQPGRTVQPVQPGPVRPAPSAGQTQLALPPGFQQPLFMNAAVRRELNITDEQLSRLSQALDRTFGRFQDDIARLNTLDERARAAQLQQLGRNFDALMMRSAGDILNEQQLTRLRQLEVQRRGFGALIDAEVQQRLNLTADQVARLRALNEEFERESRDILKGADPNRELALQRYNEFQTRIWDRVNTILNEQQRRTWAQMTGNRFVFPPEFSTTGPTTPPRP